MTTLATAVDVEFTPSKESFSVQVSGGTVLLYKKQTAGAAWVETRGGAIGRVNSNLGLGVGVVNDNIGAVYKLVTHTGTPVVQADE